MQSQINQALSQELLTVWPSIEITCQDGPKRRQYSFDNTTLAKAYAEVFKVYLPVHIIETITR